MGNELEDPEAALAEVRAEITEVEGKLAVGRARLDRLREHLGSDVERRPALANAGSLILLSAVFSTSYRLVEDPSNRVNLGMLVAAFLLTVAFAWWGARARRVDRVEKLEHEVSGIRVSLDGAHIELREEPPQAEVEEVEEVADRSRSTRGLP